MDDAEVVRRLERLGNLARDGQRVVDAAGRRAMMRVARSSPFHQLHRQGSHAGATDQAVDLRRCADGSVPPALRLRAGNGPRVRCRRQRIGQHLQRHLTLEVDVGRPIHLAHAAGAEERDDLVGAEAGAAGKCQVPDYSCATATGWPSFAVSRCVTACRWTRRLARRGTPLPRGRTRSVRRRPAARCRRRARCPRPCRSCCPDPRCARRCRQR